MLDRDLAMLYGVENFQLKRQVKRNIDRFPEDFMFVLTEKEIEQMVCHFGIPSKSYFGGAEPFVFTEQGVAMLSGVLTSPRAIKVNVEIMRAFIRLRQVLASHRELAQKLEELELHLSDHDEQIQAIFDAIRQLMGPKEEPNKRIGFQLREKRVAYSARG